MLQHHVVHDLKTGVTEQIPLTAEEIAEGEAKTEAEAKAKLAAGIDYEPLDFFKLFTVTERKTIRQAAKQSDALEDWLDMLKLAKVVNTKNAQTLAGISGMVGAGLITQERADEILA